MTLHCTICSAKNVEPPIGPYQRYFNKYSQAVNQRMFGEFFRWFFSELLFDNYTLNFDSTVMVRSPITGCVLETQRASTNFPVFFEDTLSRPENETVELVRMDSYFYTKETLDFLEYRKLSYIVVCLFDNCIKYILTHKKYG